MSSPTAALLWAGCRLEPAVDDVRAAVAAGADLDLAGEIAVAQRVSAMVWRALVAAGLTGGGHPWEHRLEADAARCRAQSRMVLPRVGELALAPLAGAGVPALVMKGIVLAGRYPDPGLRPMDDVDVVIPRQRLDDALRALTAAGWEARPAPPRRPNEIDLVHPLLPGLPLDLHRSLTTWRDRANQLTSEWLWSARRPGTVQGADVYVLSPETELVALAAHSAKPFHVFDRLVWTTDVAVLIDHAQRSGGLDWEEVGRLARSLRCRTPVAVALARAARLGVDSPAALRRIEGGRHRLAALAPVVSADWPVMAGDRNLRRSVRYALVDDRRARTALVLAEALDETPGRIPRRVARLARGRARRAWRRWLRSTGRQDVGDLVQP